MVMKEMGGIELELSLLLTETRSAIMLQVLKFPGAGPHRVLSEVPAGSRRGEEKKKTI